MRPPPSDSEPPKTQRPESFRDAIAAVVAKQFETRAKFGEALGFRSKKSPGSQINHYEKHPELIQPKSLLGMLAAITSLDLQNRLYEAWRRQFEPEPELPPDSSAEEVLRSVGELFESGRIEFAIRLARRELRRSTDFERWFTIAERLVPLYLRLGFVSKALELRQEIERRALEMRDPLALIASLAMKENAMLSVEAATPSAMNRAHKETLDVALTWHPKDPHLKRIRELRIASMSRERALQLLKFSKRYEHSVEALEVAAQEAERAFRDDYPPYMIATGLEVRSRVEAARGFGFLARTTIEDLEERGLEDGWELWEKSRMTLARVAEVEGRRDEAIQILTDVRDHCRLTNNLHHARSADQELARLMLGLP